MLAYYSTNFPGVSFLFPETIFPKFEASTPRTFAALRNPKIRIVLGGLRGEHSIAERCRREGIAESLYYTWSKEFLEAGKRRLAGDTARAAPAARSRTCAGKPGR